MFHYFISQSDLVRRFLIIDQLGLHRLLLIGFLNKHIYHTKQSACRKERIGEERGTKQHRQSSQL